MTQEQALNILKTGVNVYLTGSAGSGKTFVLNKYIQYLKSHDIDVAITASTGIAATHMNGQTIHGFAGIGVKDNFTEYDYESLLDKQYLHTRFKKTKVLIIDEVSMLHGFRLDIVDKVCKLFKRNDKPFGGLQVVLAGDFFQLPPVNKGSLDTKNDSNHMVAYSKSWRNMKPAICYLTEQHRQDDSLFLEILNCMRENSLSEKHFKEIEKRLHSTDVAVATKLFTHNADVDDINANELAKMSGVGLEYKMINKGRDVLVDILKKSCIAPERLVLKVGAEVMFIKNNFEKGYVNGTRGKIIGISSSKLPIVKCLNGKTIEVDMETWMIEDNGKILAEVKQIPLRLAWAITIHKSQGMSLDNAEIDLSKSFSYGMGYVALSRVKKLAGIKLIGFNRESLIVDPAVLALDQELKEESINNEKLFSRLPGDALIKMQQDFITRVGGTIGKAEKIKEVKNKNLTKLVTKYMLEDGKTIDEIAKDRNLKPDTIINHIVELSKEGFDLKYEQIKPQAQLIKFVSTHLKGSGGKLTPIMQALEKEGNKKYTFNDIRLAKIFCEEK